MSSLSACCASLALTLAVCFGPLAANADDTESLIRDAVRYANTSEKHAAKVAAREALKQRMPDALRVAMQYAHGDNVMLQVLVMEWVLELPAETMAPALLEFVDHERKDTRRLAIFFLGFYDVPEYAERVMPYLDDPRCRGSAIRTLGKWKVKDAREKIEFWLEEGHERVRVVAANALRDIGDPEALPALVKALDDQVFTVRNTAARAIVSFGQEAVGLLDASVSVMHQRCLADMNETGPEDLLQDGVAVEGQFFLP